MRYVRVVLAVAALVFSTTYAQVAPPKPLPRPDDLRPSLTAQEGKEIRPLQLTRADVHVVITGLLAETTLTLTFHNDLSRVLEGELTFPLPQGATVSGYGLDVGGQMVDGVPVEKEQARVAFESEVRKGVDPGLVEHVKGNNFRTRIYPIPANGDRTVKVQYVSELNTTSEDVSYLLPTNWGDQPVGEYHLKVEMVQVPGQAVLKSAPGELSLTAENGRTIAEKTFRDIKLQRDLMISIPNAPARSAIVEKRTADVQPGYYFVINDLPTPTPIKEERQAVNRIAIAWDASLSRSGMDKAREIGLLKALAAKHPSAAIDLFVFRNTVEAPVTFTLANGDASELIKFLSNLVYDGGTNLSALRLEQGGAKGAYAYWLLFTDGLSDLFAETPKAASCPVYAISNDSRSNHDLLTHLARSSGGQYFNLMRLSDEQVLANIGSTPFALLSVETNPDQVSEIYPRGVQPVLGRIAVAGRLLAPEATVTLKYGYGATVTHRETFTLRQADASSTGLAPRAWAQQKVADLSVSSGQNHEALLALGREFNLVTPNTSLMVLETLAQYLQYNITPPKSRPEIYNAYTAQVAQRDQARKQEEGKKLERILAMWNARVQWWEAKHEYAADFKYVAPPVKEGGGLAAAQGPAGSATARMSRRDAPAATAAPRPAVPDPAPVAADESRATAEGRVLEAAARFDADGVMLETKGRGSNAVRSGSTISIKPWDPETHYLIAIREAPPEKAYDVYLKERATYGSSPAFYLDCADYFLQKNQRPLAIRILTDIAELQLDNAPLFRVAAHRLMQINEHDLAIDLFEKVLKLRPEEPQSHRDLALALEARALADPASPMAHADCRRAVQLLSKLVMGTWDGRFPEIEVIALEELNDLIAKSRAMPQDKPIIADLDPRLLKLLDMDVRIVLTWDADLTDIDLWVTEPSGEKCMYNHNRTVIGGLVSNDFTQGYGPEEYCLRKAMKGEYKIQANFYGSRQQSLTGPTTIQATVITHFGRPDEKRQSLTVRLAVPKDVVDLGTIRID